MNPSGEISNYKLVKPGDVIISLRSADGGFETSDINRYIKGIRDGKNIYFDDIKDILIPFCPYSNWDKKQIILESYHSKLVSSFAKFDTQIKFLNEYRKSLISSVVSGKFRITEDFL